ncbi:MAG: glycosyltransferase [Anaerolineae bacterium]|nr:glycosyltransferase [Anaerolineae bacterium]MDW8068856.1 glycosyltransferase [Anaerolineae bacterium]
MRIGLLTDSYWPGVNGIIRFVSLHKRILESMGHQVFVFTGGPPAPQDEPGVVRSFGFPHPDPGYRITLGYSRRAVALLQTMDVLHANQPALSGLLALQYGRRFGIPVVLTLHSRYDMLVHQRLRVPLSVTHALLGAYLRWALPRCDLVTAPTPEVVRVLDHMGVRVPVEIIPHGVDREQSCHRSVTRAELGIPPTAPLAAYVGRVVAEKNVRFLLEVLANPELSDAYLLVVGDGPERKALEPIAQRLGVNERVRFVGQIAPAEVPAYVALADFCVTASKIEMLPTAILEALGAGRPVLGLDVPWIRAVIRPGENGLLTPPDDVAAMARAWAQLAHNRELRERMAEGARRTGEQYDARQATTRLVAHYERLITARRARTRSFPIAFVDGSPPQNARPPAGPEPLGPVSAGRRE